MTFLSAQPVIDSLRTDIQPNLTLAVIWIGDNPASEIYISKKQEALMSVGGRLELHHLSSQTTEIEALRLIQDLNLRDDITGIIVQLPLPRHIDQQILLNAIAPYKDPDGLSTYWLGRIMQARTIDQLPTILPATPKGIILLLTHYHIPLPGKHILLINDSVLIGKPLLPILVAHGATVTMAHKQTHNIPSLISQVDIIISATGDDTIVTESLLLPHQTVIDVGIIRKEDNLIHGDIYKPGLVFEGNITPVPGGIGPMTVWGLLVNLSILKKIQSNQKP